jgi:hypothetical protein
MKKLVGVGVLTLLTVMSLPSTSDAFSRRSHSSEVTQTSPTQTGNLSTENRSTSAQAVPEPPLLLVMSIGLGAFAFVYALRRYKRRPS